MKTEPQMLLRRSNNSYEPYRALGLHGVAVAQAWLAACKPRRRIELRSNSYFPCSTKMFITS